MTSHAPSSADLDAEPSDVESRFRSILVSAPDAFISLDANGAVLEWNDQAAAMFGWSRDEVLGRPLHDIIIPEEFRGAHIEGIKRFQRTGDGAMVRTRLQVVALHRSGRSVPIELSIAPFKYRDGWGANAFLHDITERQAAQAELLASREQLRRAGELAAVGAWSVELSTTTMVWSDVVRRIYGVDDAFEPSLSAAVAPFEPEFRQLVANAFADGLARGKRWEFEAPLRSADGRRVWVRAIGDIELDAAGTPIRMVGALQDISEQHEVRAQLFRQQRTLSSVAEAIPDIIAVVDRNGSYEFVNTAFEALLDSGRGCIVGQPFGEMLRRAGHDGTEHIHKALGGASTNFDLKMEIAGAVRHMSASFISRKSQDGSPDGFISILQDVTHHKEVEVRLTKLSQRDSLTGLANRQGLDAFLTRQDQAKAAGVAVLYIDLDRFKPVNDAHGHSVGDKLLRAVADRLKALVRPTDLVARLGGDEFLIVLVGMPTEAAANSVADKVVAALGCSFTIDNQLIEIGASVGVALGAEQGWEDLVDRADAAVYRAKSLGRGRRA